MPRDAAGERNRAQRASRRHRAVLPCHATTVLAACWLLVAVACTPAPGNPSPPDIIAGCADGYLDCNGRLDDGCEVDGRSSTADCGACGHSCHADHAAAACTGGACTLQTCDPGWADCNGVPGDGCEVHVDDDPAHCGHCGDRCAPPHAVPACATGTCQLIACLAGWGDCNHSAGDGCEVATDSDLLHCGACDHECIVPNGTPACSGGKCGVDRCSDGWADCNADPADGCESDLGALASCGACGVKCVAPPNAAPACKAGVCALGVCDAGHADCDHQFVNGCEVDTDTDIINCGGCGKTCVPAHAKGACAAGACAITSCVAGFADCDRLAVNGCEVSLTGDAFNCGACGMRCRPGEICSGAACGVLHGWALLQPLHSPPASGAPAMAFDSQRNVAVLFAGPAGTWEWDGGDWHQVATLRTPPSPSGDMVVYDSARKRVVDFGGLTGAGCARLLGETWEYDGVDWTRVVTQRSPSPRAFGGMAYDSRRGVTVQFGGDYCVGGGIGYSGETWEYDGVNWTQAKPPHAPVGRDDLSMAFDSLHAVTVMTQGGGMVALTPDTWTFDGIDWIQAHPQVSPPLLAAAGIAFAPDFGVAVLFGGGSGLGGFGTDTWEWDGAQWTDLMPVVKPSGRFHPAMAYDAARKQVVLWGGNANLASLGDTWIYAR